MLAFFEKKYSPFIVLFLLVLISRLPFLSAGYGAEEDSWGIALAAFHTKCTGIYEPSRLPGHPFQEYIYSFLWGSGPFVYNLLCAVFSAVGAVFFALILKHLKFRLFFIAALAFSLVPVYYISSTYTIDFVWTQALILIAFYCLLKHTYVACGVFLGLAVGCRITSGAMLIPFMIICWQSNFRQNVIHFFKLVIPMSLIAIILFIPVYVQFGSSFFMYYDQFPYPPFTKVMYKMTIGVVGLTGFLASCFFLLVAFLKKKQQQAGESFDHKLDKKILLASIAVIVLYIISYFRLPQKSGYMIPVLPFVILLFGYYLNKRNFLAFSFCLCLSSFLFSINLTDSHRGAAHSKSAMIFNVSGQELFLDPLSGPLFSDYSKRKQKMAFTDSVIRKTANLNSKTVVIAGWWYNEIMVKEISLNKNKLVIYEFYIDQKTMEKYKENNYELFYLPEQNKYNDLKYGMEVTDQYAKAFNW